MSDKDAKFTSKFWKELFACLGTELAFSANYYPQTDGKYGEGQHDIGGNVENFLLH